MFLVKQWNIVAVRTSTVKLGIQELETWYPTRI